LPQVELSLLPFISKKAMRISNPSISYFYRLVDVGIIFFTGLVTLHIRFWNSAIPNDSYNSFIFGACVIYLLLSSPLVAQQNLSSLIQTIARVIKLWSITFIAISMLIIFTQSGNLLSRIWLVIWAGLSLPLLTFGNLAIENIIWRFYGYRLTKKKVAIIGHGAVVVGTWHQVAPFASSFASSNPVIVALAAVAAIGALTLSALRMKRSNLAGQ
jgi:hypothetical protein